MVSWEHVNDVCVQPHFLHLSGCTGCQSQGKSLLAFSICNYRQMIISGCVCMCNVGRMLSTLNQNRTIDLGFPLIFPLFVLLPIFSHSPKHVTLYTFPLFCPLCSHSSHLVLWFPQPSLLRPSIITFIVPLAPVWTLAAKIIHHFHRLGWVIWLSH